MSSIHVRAAAATDAPAIGLAHVLAWQHAYRGMMPDTYLDGLRVDDRIDMWRRALTSDEPPSMLVVEVGGALAGFAVFGAERVDDGDEPTGDGELYAINLHPDHWARGAGRTLLRATTDALTALGFHEAVLWVLPDNQRARRLYESEGWADDGAVVTGEVMDVTVPEMRYRRRLA